ncbi:MAG: TonB family protein [Blastocatellia bacterium]
MKRNLNLFAWGILMPAAWGMFPGAIRAMGQERDFESRAISRAQQAPANQLDPALPARPFGRWFSQLVGADAGVSWQVTDCGEQAGAGLDRDVPACVEATAVLPGDRMIIVSLLVGTFRQGLIGDPAEQLIAVEDFGILTPIKRLSELDPYLRRPAVRPRQTASPLPPARPGRFPRVVAGPFMANAALAGAPPADIAAREEAPAPPRNPLGVDGSLRIPPDVLEERAITRVTPAYPALARQINASGEVQVRITINEEGRVVEAVALSGHPMLRTPAEDAARRWTFKPAAFNGTPVKSQGVLTFVFTRNNQ